MNAFLKKIDLTYGEKYKETTSLLQRLVENNSNLHKSLSEPTNKLFQELLLDMEFKEKLMGVFLVSYEKNSMALARGFSGFDDSIFDFSVQLLSIPSLVKKHANLDGNSEMESIIIIVLKSLRRVLSLAVNGGPRKDAASEGIEGSLILRQGRYRVSYFDL